MIIGAKEQLMRIDLSLYLPIGANALLETMLNAAKPGANGDLSKSWIIGPPPHRLVLAVLPEECSRHNSPTFSNILTGFVQDHLPDEEVTDMIILLDKAEYALAAGSAVERALPTYSAKSNDKDKEERRVSVHLMTSNGPIAEIENVRHTAESVRWAASLVDMPTSELHTNAFVATAEELASELGVKATVIKGEALREQGFGGLWNVGKTAINKPALVVLSYEPQQASRTVVWVGKGIVYDTGGLSLKPGASMAGMKSDMAGAAAVLAAFAAAVRLNFRDRLHAVLCLAENAIGPEALRPDDIIKLYSGKTVEINNTDAEGRLVLADGIAYAVAHLKPDVIVDLATLTGAQMIATGKRHAAIICNDEGLEQAAIKAGRKSGDLVHPLPYCPELFRSEFKSKVADMKNSSKDRLNAQPSCAAQFIAEHLGDYKGPWLHVDIAGPSMNKERGTGFGVAFLMTLFG
jgi:probable aminopeptidase NPEPL1